MRYVVELERVKTLEMLDQQEWDESWWVQNVEDFKRFPHVIKHVKPQDVEVAAT